MKRIFFGILTFAVVLSLGATNAFALCHTSRRNFTDADSNICNFVDLDNDGICDNCGIPCQCGTICAGNGGNYVDADGDGICDHHADGLGWGCGRGNASRGGCGRNYTDTDGDGICDNYFTTQGRRGGHGGRGRCGR